jgi:hypothetical protein
MFPRVSVTALRPGDENAAAVMQALLNYTVMLSWPEPDGTEMVDLPDFSEWQKQNPVP